MRRLGLRRFLSITTVAALTAFVALEIVPSANGASSVTTRRLGGTDRYDTARVVAGATFGTSGYAVLATGERFPDALTGSYVAGAAPTGPILLTQRDSLPSSTASSLSSLGVKTILILGGTAAVSTTVEQDLHNRGYTTRRIAGNTRYDTAQAAAELFGASGVGKIGSDPTAIVASGENFPDALAGGPPSFLKRFPILLTAHDALSPQASAALSDLGIKRALLLGGENAVGAPVAAAITAKGIVVDRLSGPDRQATAVAVANFETGTLGFSNGHVNLARGDNFPDSLAGGPHGGKDSSGASIVLTLTPNDLSSETRDYLKSMSNTITSIDAFGGTAAISDAVLDEARGDSTCTAPSTAPTTAPVTPTAGSCQPGATTTAPSGGGSSGFLCPPFPAQFCATAPAPPRNVATSVSGLTVTISFLDSISPTVTSYKIYRATTSLTSCPQFNFGFLPYSMITQTVDTDPSTASNAAYSYKNSVSSGAHLCYVATAVIDSTGAESDPAPSNPPPVTNT